jgi:hypothetical protein
MIAKLSLKFIAMVAFSFVALMGCQPQPWKKYQGEIPEACEMSISGLLAN